MTEYTNEELIRLSELLSEEAEEEAQALCGEYKELAESYRKLSREHRAIAQRLRETQNRDDYLHNVRRTAERGLKVCQGTETNMAPDIFQHILDELVRAGISSPTKQAEEG